MYPQVFLLCIEYHFKHKSDYKAQKQLWARLINLKKKNKIVDADTSLLHTVLDCDGSSFSVHTGLSCFLSTALLAIWVSRASCNNCINFCGRLIGNSNIEQRSEERKMNSHTHTHTQTYLDWNNMGCRTPRRESLSPCFFVPGSHIRKPRNINEKSKLVQTTMSNWRNPFTPSVDSIRILQIELCIGSEREANNAYLTYTCDDLITESE